MKDKVVIIFAFLILIIIGVIVVFSFINNVNTQNNHKVTKKTQEEIDFEKLKEILNENVEAKIFVTNSSTEEQLKQYEEELNSLTNIEVIEFVSKEDALDMMKDKFNDDNTKTILNEYEGDNNIFPNSYIVKIKLNDNLQTVDEIQEYFDNKKEEMESVDGVIKVTMSTLTLLEIYKEYGIEALEIYSENGMKALNEYIQNSK
jgi:hypothetical protein